MGVINLSPESRNLHTVADDLNDAIAMARRYRRWGATIIDLGAQSSHYENPTISSELEMDRLLPVVTALAGEGFAVSVDTWKPDVAQAAKEAGAVLVNDTGGLSDPKMREVVARTGVAAVVVYVEGANPHDVGEIDTSEGKAAMTAEVFRRRLDDLAAEGITELVIDPGIALNYRGDYQAYTRLQLEVIRESGSFHELGRPVMIPIPRKKETHRVMAYVTLALEYGADLIRVHDVAEACDLVALFDRTAPEVAR
ncbi:MAG: dihydropteroate synthase [Actinomycetota bacterium]